MSFKKEHLGYCKGKKLSEEHKRKISESSKGHIGWNKGLKGYTNKGSFKKGYSSWNKGIKAPQISKAKIGHIVTEETRKKISEKNKGRIFSKETRKKMSLANKGRNKGIRLSQEHRKKISEANKGKPSGRKGKKLSEEIKLKISLSQKGKKLSEETKQKIKETWNKPFMIQIAKERRKNIIIPKKDTSIEIKIQEFLKQLNIAFFTHQYMHIEHGYQCDIFIPVQRNRDRFIRQPIIIECDGDYWHGNKNDRKGRILNKYQLERIKIDKIRTSELIEKGFKVLRLWEMNINKMNLNEFVEKIKDLHINTGLVVLKEEKIENGK